MDAGVNTPSLYQRHCQITLKGYIHVGIYPYVHGVQRQALSSLSQCSKVSGHNVERVPTGGGGRLQVGNTWRLW